MKKTKEILLDEKWFSVAKWTMQDEEKSSTFTGLEMKTANVVVLPFVTENGGVKEIGVLREFNPLRAGDYSLTLVSGNLEPKENSLSAAIRELKEETGFEVPDDHEKIYYLGDINFAKLLSGGQKCYAIDVTGLTAGEVVTDGSLSEAMAEFKFISPTQALKEGDAYILSCLFKLTMYFLAPIYAAKS